MSGWRTRGYLPHFDVPGTIQAINFRLSDALPDHVVQGWEDELRYEPDEVRRRELRRMTAKYEDAGHGCCVLRYDEAAELVQNAFLHFDEERYQLLAWVVMPNHVHVMIVPLADWSLGELIGSWKTYTSRRIHERFEACRPLWQREYFDRFIRDDLHYENSLRYIEMNPVEAGLCATSEEFRWSSAYRPDA